MTKVSVRPIKTEQPNPVRKSTGALEARGRAWPKTALILLASLVLVATYSAVVYAAPQSQDPDIPTEAERTLFTKGQTFYANGGYAEAVNTFNEFLESYPNSSIKDLTLLWLGRSYLRQGDIARAERMSSRLREIPSTPYRDVYEDELRIARHDYGRPTAPSIAPLIAASIVPLSKNDSSASTAPRISQDKRESEPVVSAPPKSTVALSKTASQVANKPLIQPAIQPVNQPVSRAANQAAHPVSNQIVNRATGQGGSVPALSAARLSPAPKVPAKTETVAPSASAVRTVVVVPELRVAVEDLPNSAAANGVRFYRLVIRNEGNTSATNVVVREELDGSLNFASSDPAPTRQEIVGQSLVLTYRLIALKAGETKAIRIAVRPRLQREAKSAGQIKHSVTYSDAKGNTYHTP